MRRLAFFVAVLAVALAACGNARQLNTSSTIVGAADVERGNKLMQNHGCLGCHTANGNISSGPTIKGLAGSTVELKDGSSVVADDDYLRRAIEQPNVETVKGFPEGLMSISISQRQRLTPQEIDDVIAYIDSLK